MGSLTGLLYQCLIPRFADIDCVPDAARLQPHEMALSNAFGFGGTNCCIVFRGVAG